MTIFKNGWRVGKTHFPGRKVLLGATALLGILMASKAIAGRATYRDDPTYLIDTWETEDGLPGNTTTAMAQTRDGYLWFGTFGGLVRFDGVKFDVFNRANTPQLPSAGIVNLHLDRRGWLWVSTTEGMVVLADNKWRTFGTNDGWAGNFVRTFAERGNGDLLLTTFDGKVLEFANGRLGELPDPPGAPGSGYAGCVDEMGQWWVAQHGFIGRWDGHNWVETLAVTNSEPAKVWIISARGGGTWLFINNDLRKYRNGTELSRLELSGPLLNPWNMFEDSGGNLWICTREKGVRQVSSAGKVRQWTLTNGLSDENPSFVFEDRENDLWVGSGGGGLQRFKLRRFHSFEAEGRSLPHVASSVSASSAGDVWVATYGQGLFRHDTSGVTKIALPQEAATERYLQSVLEDGSGRVWVGTYGHGLWVMDKKDDRFFSARDIGGGNVIALFEDSHGHVWVSGGETASVYDGGAFRVFGPEDGLPHGAVYCFAEGSSGEVWLAQQGGVFRFLKGRFVIVNDESGRPLRDIACLRRDSNDAMWMGSNTRGLIRWREGHITAVGAATGLPASAISSIIEDHRTNWWMTSEHGVIHVPLADLQAVADGVSVRVRCEVLDMSDGLPGTDFSSERQPISTRDTSGKLWFAMSKGVAEIDPEEFYVNEKPPPTHIEEVNYYVASFGAANGRHVQWMQQNSEKLSMPAGSRRLEIHYTGLSFVTAGKVRFQIKLTPGDEDWQDVGGLRVVDYYGLQPADYVFRVRAANNDGVWNETGASLAFAVQPFFWQTWWFRVAVLAALVNLGGFAAWGRARRGHQRELAEVEKEKLGKQDFARRLIMSQENERKRVAAELHDGLGQDLLLIKNRLTLATARKADPVELTAQLDAAFAATVRAFGEIRTISHALRPASLDQAGLTKAIAWTVEQLGESSTTKFSADLDNIDGLFSPEMEINIFRTIQEGLNNITQHAGAARSILEVKREEAEVRVSLFDNGRGFDADKQCDEPGARRGLGLDSMDERAKCLGGTLEIQSAPERGTRITMRIPLPKTKD